MDKKLKQGAGLVALQEILEQKGFKKFSADEIKALNKVARIFGTPGVKNWLDALEPLHEQGNISRFYPYFSVDLLVSLVVETQSVLHNHPELDIQKMKDSSGLFGIG